jgi:hypothetical protein
MAFIESLGLIDAEYEAVMGGNAELLIYNVKCIIAGSPAGDFKNEELAVNS